MPVEADVDKAVTLLFVVDSPVDSELTPVDRELVAVESDPMLLFAVLSPVDSESTPLCAVLMPVEAEVDSAVTLLLVVDRPVDSEATPLEAEVDKRRYVAVRRGQARRERIHATLGRADARRGRGRQAPSHCCSSSTGRSTARSTPLCAVLIPVEAEVDSAVTLLLVVDRPVESEVTPLCAVLIPVDAEVDNAVTLLFVVDRPVDSEATPLDAEVDSDADIAVRRRQPRRQRGHAALRRADARRGRGRQRRHIAVRRRQPGRQRGDAARGRGRQAPSRCCWSWTGPSTANPRRSAPC